MLSAYKLKKYNRDEACKKISAFIKKEGGYPDDARPKEIATMLLNYMDAASEIK